MTSASSVVDYDLNIHDGEVTTVLRLRDTGIRLDGDRLCWCIGGDARDAALTDIEAIRLTTEAETARGPMGATSCQIRFFGGRAVTVFGGNSLSRDPVERRRRYEAFVTELHRRLAPGDRARIRFIAGYGGGRFALLLVSTVISTLFLILAPLALLFGAETPHLRILFAIVFGVVLTVGLFRLLQLNAPHVYDPGAPLYSATAGSIGDTLGTAIHEFRRGMTRAKGLAFAAIDAALIVVVVLAVASHQRVSLFEPGQARLAFDAVFVRAGPSLPAVYVAVTPDELLVEGPPGDDSSSRIDWRANRRTLFGWSEWDDVSGPTVRYPMSMSDEPGEEKFKLEPGDTTHLDDLAKAAIERTALGADAHVTRMTLIAPYTFVNPEPPRWTVEVAGNNRMAEIIADRHGQLYPATPDPAGPPRIVLKAVPGNVYSLFPANSGTWIRVINPDQSVRFDATLKPGDSYRVPDIPGIRLQTGKPETLEVTVDGRPARLPPAGYAGRLDAVLDPQSLLSAVETQR
jgi:Domain of unknown function (DUF4115)